MWLLCNEQDYIFEAKKVEISISERSSIYMDKIIKSLQTARHDAANSRDYEQKAIGLLFIVPYIHKSEENPKKCIKDFIADIQSIDYGFMAYTFPRGSENLMADGYYYPGVVLMGRRPRR